MSFFGPVSRLLSDPPPSHVFELSESGVAFALGTECGFLPFKPGALAASPVVDNLVDTDEVTAALRSIAPVEGSKKRRRAAVILPDYATRVSVLDFDSFPSGPEEQLSLIRFRLKKTLPFDIDSAAVSYHAQPAPKGRKLEVVVAVVALEIIARYEVLFRALNFYPGEITTSGLAALNLFSEASSGDEVAVVAKLGGHVLTVMVLRGGTLKLFRCVALEELTEQQVMAVLQPTYSYVEDELASPVGKLILCGFQRDALSRLAGERDELRSRYGTPGAHNAGLLGYLEGTRN